MFDCHVTNIDKRYPHILFFFMSLPVSVSNCWQMITILWKKIIQKKQEHHRTRFEINFYFHQDLRWKKSTKTNIFKKLKKIHILKKLKKIRNFNIFCLPVSTASRNSRTRNTRTLAMKWVPYRYSGQQSQYLDLNMDILTQTMLWWKCPSCADLR